MNEAQFSSALGLDSAGRLPADITILLTDSRSLTDAAHSAFFAIPTKVNDGHRFIPQLYAAGVRNFVVTRIPDEMKDAADANFFIVDSTAGALQKIAARRDGFHGEMVAICGSAGKTTLKEWLFQALEPLFTVARSPRSYNSQIGVPLSLWEVKSDDQLALIEAGISRPGEMKALADTISPDTVIYTNIAAEQDDEFASLGEKAAEKAVMAAGKTIKTVIYPADSHLLAYALKRKANPEAKLIGWSMSSPAAPLFIKSLSRPDDSSTLIDYVWQGTAARLVFPMQGDAAVETAISALAFMLHLGIAPDVIARRFRSLHPIATRLNVSEGVNGCSLIYDSYTSDLSSLRQALDFMRRRATAGRSATLIISDMRHEASLSDLYPRMARLVSSSGVKRFIGIGPVISANASLFGPGAEFFSSTAEFLKHRSPADFSDEFILIKGAPEFEFYKILEILEARKHETVLEVNLDSIIKNYNYFRQQLHPTTGVIAMVKASGYGAGSYEIAKTLQDSGAAYLAVAVLDEGIELRKGGITMPIMVMNPRVANYKNMFAYRLEPEIYNFEMLEEMIREARKNGVTSYPVHIKLDTGMHRMGFIESEVPALMDLLESAPEVRAATVFSHLATADCVDMDDYTLGQLQLFARTTEYMMKRYPSPLKRHILNSAGILRFPEYQYDMVRLGIGLYGANTLPPEIEKPLAPVSTLRTVIITIREWKEGETIGYGRKGKLTRPSRIATIPIGYADGMNRHFGCGAVSVYVAGKWAPTVGNICMDACMIDVTDIDCAVGDEVEIFGPNAPVSRLSDVLDTIPYEVLTSVSPRVKRVYYRE